MDIIKAKVIHGQGKGAEMGFATANQQISQLEKLPEIGVYASKVKIDDKQYIGITNVGTRPTVDDAAKITIETHVLDYSGDLYGKIIEVDLVYRIRDIKKFANTQQLLKQINDDKETARELWRMIDKS
ncbi:MAG: riboflavin kinase [Erysipelotrichaceae bacterium]|nr:riboflavin kinase [Erysipelotrichaceae bacterium]